MSRPRFSSFPDLRSSRGAGLLSAIIAIGISGVIVTVIGMILSSSMERMQVIIRASDLRELRLYLALNSNCGQIKAKYPACTGSTIELLNSDKAAVVATSGTQIGKFVIRAACNGGQLVPEFRSQNASTWEALYTKKAPFPCGY